MLIPYIWGLVNGVRVGQSEPITNAKLNQTSDAITSAQAAITEIQTEGVGFAVVGGVSYPITAREADSSRVGFRLLEIPNA